MTAIRLASVIASSWSWVTTTKVVFSWYWRLASSNWVCSRSFLSSAARGSSSSSSLGRLTSARASATRCCSPPESLSGLRRASASQLDQLQHLGDAFPDLRLGHAFLLQAVGDVLVDRHVGKQRVGLEHHVDRALVGRHGGHVHAVDEDAAGRRLLEAGQHAQQRRLAAAGAAENREELAAMDVERHPVDRRDAVEQLRHVADLHQRGAFRRAPRGLAAGGPIGGLRAVLAGRRASCGSLRGRS